MKSDSSYKHFAVLDIAASLYLEVRNRPVKRYARAEVLIFYVINLSL